jgi:hypothetical protein
MGYIKLAFGVFSIITGLVDKQIYISALGALLFTFTLLNKGSCPGGSCSVPPRSRK